MNVAGDGDAFWHASFHPSEMIFTIPSSHIYYRSVECFQEVLIHKHRCTLMPLEKVIDAFERNLFGTSALLSVFSQREKNNNRGQVFFVFPISCSPPSVPFLSTSFALSRRIITVLLNILFSSILSFYSPDKCHPSPAKGFRK